MRRPPKPFLILYFFVSVVFVTLLSVSICFFHLEPVQIMGWLLPLYFFSALALWKSLNHFDLTENELKTYRIDLQNLALERTSFLQDGENRLKAIFNAVPDAIIIIDQNGIIENVNPSVQGIFGFSCEEMLGNNIHMIMPEPYKSNHDAYLKRYLQTKSSDWLGKTREVLAKRKNGELFPAELHIKEFSLGAKTMFAGIMRDVTEQRKHVDQIKHQAAFMENNPGPVLRVGFDGEILEFNPAARIFLGPNLLRRNLLEIFRNAPPFVTLSLKCPDRKQFEEPIGKLIFLFNITPHPEDQAFYLYGSDITERKKAEDQLRILSRALEESPASVIITDIQGSIQYVNPKFVQLTGFSKDEAFGKNPRILKSGKHDIQIYKTLWDTILSGKEWYGELLNKKKNGELYWEKALISPVRNSDRVITHFVGVKEDITEKRKTAEELNLAKETADQANRAKSDFLANMSHEIRTPMNAIIGIVYLALQTDLSPKQRELIKKIESAMQSLLGIINDILDVSKIEAGRMVFEKIEFSFKKNLDDLITFFSFKAKDKGLNLFIKTDPRIPSTLLGDPLRLGQILNNLVNNALKFTQQGEIEVNVEMQAENNENVILKFSVRDTGIGISEDEVPRIFKPFSQADFSTARKFGGTGLGLTICKRLVGLMGGEISLKSKPQLGSIFSFSIPFGKVVTAQATVGFPNTKNLIDPQNKPSLYGKRILLVEDNQINREVAREILQKTGAFVDEAHNGKEALKAVSKHTYDTILMDIQMPEMDGYETVSKIRTIENLREVPIIAMTANAMLGDREKALKAGMNDHVAKPIDPPLLLETLNRWANFGETPIPSTVGSERIDLAKNKFPSLPGIDTFQGLSRLGGNLENYRKLLFNFFDEQKIHSREFQKALQRNDWDSLKFMVHDLKGLSGTIGAQGIQKLALELEKSISEGNHGLLREKATLLQEELKKVLSSIETLKNKAYAESNEMTRLIAISELNLSNVIPIISELKKLLQNYDFQAFKCFSSLKNCIPPCAYKEDFKELENTIDRFDFEKAYLILEKIYETLRIQNS